MHHRGEHHAIYLIAVTDPRTHPAKHPEVAHYQGQHYLVERSHEPFVAILGIEEYRLPPVLNRRTHGAHRETDGQPR